MLAHMRDVRGFLDLLNLRRFASLGAVTEADLERFAELPQIRRHNMRSHCHGT
jgi:hypothetical protein